MRPADAEGSWTILTGHGHVLVEIARNPEARVLDICRAAGVTERTAHAIIADLEKAGYLTRARAGRRTHYTINPDARFRHRSQDGYLVGPLLHLLTAPNGTAESADDVTPDDGRASPVAGDHLESRLGRDA